MKCCPCLDHKKEQGYRIEAPATVIMPVRRVLKQLQLPEVIYPVFDTDKNNWLPVEEAATWAANKAQRPGTKA